jgi:hypothetical protein
MSGFLAVSLSFPSLATPTGQLPPATLTTNQSTGLTTYTNEPYGIAFDFPTDWPVGQKIVAQDQLLHITPPNEEANRIPQTSKTGSGFTVTASIINPSSYLDPSTLQVKTLTPTAMDYATLEKTNNAETEAASA